MVKQKSTVTGAELKARLRSAMNAGFSLSLIVKQCGLSQYRISSIVNDIAQGRVAGGDFAEHETAKISHHLDIAKKVLTDGLSRGLFAGVEKAVDVGVKCTTISKGAGVTNCRLRNYMKVVSSGRDDNVIFDAEEKKRLTDHLEMIKDSI